jgi:mono/diheme cytochrome c family protein
MMSQPQAPKPGFLGILLFLSLLSILPGCQNNASTNRAEDASSASIQQASSTSGADLFQAHCVRCHAVIANQMPPVISGSASLKDLTQFTRQLRQPASPMMKSFSEEELDEKAMDALYQYITEAR